MLAGGSGGAGRTGELALRGGLEGVGPEPGGRGVQVPGGVEAMVFFRDLVENAALDVDLENCFRSLEWNTMRNDVLTCLPDFAPWQTWKHQQGSIVILPSGGERVLDEQDGITRSRQSFEQIGCLGQIIGNFLLVRCWGLDSDAELSHTAIV